MPGLLTAVLLSASAAAGAGGLPDGLNLRYTLQYGAASIGETERVLERRGPVYRVTSRTRPRGLGRLLGVERLDEAGEFTVAAGLPRPRYYHQAQYGKRPYVREARFDWRAGRLHYADGRTEVLPARTQDQGSEWFALMLAAGRGAFPLELTVTDGRRLSRYRYELSGEETLKGPLGPLHSLRIQRTKIGGKGRVVLWLASGHGYLPVKIVKQRPGRPDTILTLSQLITAPIGTPAARSGR